MKRYQLPFTLLALLLLALGHIAFAQQLPQEDRSAADVAGTWMIYTHGDDGKTGTHTVQIVQNGNTLTGHFKGPYQSGGIEGTMNVRHIRLSHQDAERAHLPRNGRREHHGRKLWRPWTPRNLGRKTRRLTAVKAKESSESCRIHSLDVICSSV